VRRPYAFEAVGPNRYREVHGLYYDEFDVGDVIEHRPGRTVTATDNMWLSLLSLNAHPLHIDEVYAGQTEFGQPLVSSLVTLSIVGGLSILLGFHGKLGAWLLVLFLLPVTLTMHNFWAVKDPVMQQVQMAMFLKNISMLGSALFFTQIGTGPLSLDSRRAPAH